MRLEDKSILVTGASSGIGRTIALACARAGADLAITYRRNAAGAEQTAGEIQRLGRRAEILQADIGEATQVQRLAEEAKARLGRVDVWINNAGADILTGEGRQLARLAKLDLLLAVDLRGTVLASWAAVDLMRAQGGGGAIINMSWDHVTVGMPGENPVLFSAVKGGILSFSKSLAREVGPAIRVNTLAPGFIETAFGQDAREAFRQEVIARTPLARWGVPEDVARAAVFLASDDAAFMTGQVVMVNGGMVM